MPEWIVAIFQRAEKRLITGSVTIRFLEGRPVKWEMEEVGQAPRDRQPDKS